MEILDYLEELDVEDFDNSEGYRITLVLLIIIIIIILYIEI